MARGITLHWASSRFLYGQHDGIRVRVEATVACDMPDKIFAYRMLPVNPATGQEAGFFSHITSPADIADYPEDEPVESHRPKWFRLNYVDAHLRSPLEAQQLVDAIREDVRRLVRTLQTMETLVPGGTETVGAACPVDEPPLLSSSSTSSQGSEADPYGSLTVLEAVGSNDRSYGLVGAPWSQESEGAETPEDESSFAHVTLYPGETSHLLLIQGFDFSDLADDALIEGIELELGLRWVEDNGGFSSCPQVTFLALHHPEQGTIENRGAGQCVTGPAFSSLVEGATATCGVKHGQPG